MSAITTVLWPGCKAEVGADLLNGGTLADKPGYHNTRNRLKQTHPNDYSIQLAIDKEGPGDQASAIDLTFKSAQAGNFRNINKYSNRLLKAGKEKDPRAYPLREFQGNTDTDRDVEGWSYYRGHAITTTDKSHLWHIHLSIHRKYINNEAAMRSILSIWNGDDPVVYPTPKTDDVYLSKLKYGQQDSDSVWHLQKALNALGANVALTGTVNKATFEAWARELFDAADVPVTIHNDL